jgi:hypothetical protein
MWTPGRLVAALRELPKHEEKEMTMINSLRKIALILSLAVLTASVTPFAVSALSISYLGGTIQDIKENLIKINGRYYVVNKKALIKKNVNSKEEVVSKRDLHIGQVVNYRYAGSQIFFIYIVR